MAASTGVLHAEALLRGHGYARVLARPQHRLGCSHCRRLALVSLLSRLIAQQQPPELLVVHCAGSMQIAVSRSLAVWTNSANLEAQALARGWHTCMRGSSTTAARRHSGTASVFLHPHLLCDASIVPSQVESTLKVSVVCYVETYKAKS
jgi:hypothetical protein